MAETIRVLLVDDDPSYHTLTSRMLAHSEQDFVVDWAESFADGLEMMLEERHDVYLLDYNLGRKSGIELMTEAAAKGVDVPVIMMTGHGKRGLDMEALRAGASDYIDKVELRPASLQRSIRYALERSRILKAQRASEEMYRSLIENAFDGILITDYDGTIYLSNSRVHDLMQTSEKVLHKLNVRDFIMGANANDDVLDVGTGAVAERVLKRPNGTELHVEVGASPIDSERLQFIVRDVTGRKESLIERDRYIEQLMILRQIDEEISQSLNIDFVLAISLDAAQRLSGSNTGFIALVDDENNLRMSQAIGRYSSRLADDSFPDMPLVHRMLDEQEARLILDVSTEPDYAPLVDGTKAQMLLPMLSYDKMVGIVNLETNHPERFTEEVFDFLKLIASRAAVGVENAGLYKIAQDRFNELQVLYTQVSGLEQLKTDMIRIAAHDIRNPVSVVLGYTELMEAMIERNNIQKLRSYITMVERAARRMEKITTDILSLERIENMQEDSDASLDLCQMVRETFEEFEGQAGLKSQKLTMYLPDTTIFVRGDAAQMREAAANLISNAIKYTQEGGDIQINVERQDDDVLFTVVDNGFGIMEEQQASLFQPFFRATSTETQQIEGTGLGLYLIKNIVERYGGEILFTSVYGEGSTFGFKLPLFED